MGDGLVRVSVGLEDPQDLVADLDQTLRARTAKGLVGLAAYQALKRLARAGESGHSPGYRGESMDIRAYNRSAWDQQVADGNPWTVPVSPGVIEAARRGDWQIILTPTKPVPVKWFPALTGTEVLCLASGGGQQAPVLAAAGARVTVLDNSPRQLAQDRLVAERDDLEIATVEGDMADLCMFADQTFGLIVHPVANLFVPDVQPVWAEAFRVLRPGGALLAGFCNPVIYIFDQALFDRGELIVRHPLPYSDLSSLPESERERYLASGEPLEFGHTLEDQIGGQIDAGFLLAGLYEDSWGQEEGDPLSQYLPAFIATRAVKPDRRS